MARLGKGLLRSLLYLFLIFCISTPCIPTVSAGARQNLRAERRPGPRSADDHMSSGHTRHPKPSNISTPHQAPSAGTRSRRISDAERLAYLRHKGPRNLTEAERIELLRLEHRQRPGPAANRGSAGSSKGLPQDNDLEPHESLPKRPIPFSKSPTNVGNTAGNPNLPEGGIKRPPAKPSRFYPFPIDATLSGFWGWFVGILVALAILVVGGLLGTFYYLQLMREKIVSQSRHKICTAHISTNHPNSAVQAPSCQDTTSKPNDHICTCCQTCAKRSDPSAPLAARQHRTYSVDISKLDMI